MLPTRIPGATRELGKPKDWIDAEHGVCNTLAIRDQVVDGLHEMVSAWAPSIEELARIAAGAPVHLTIVGTSHPPVMLSVGDAAAVAPDAGTDVVAAIDAMIVSFRELDPRNRTRAYVCDTILARIRDIAAPAKVD